MTHDTGSPVLTRDWLLGYFGIYPPVPPIVRYSHDAAAPHAWTATVRQIMLLDRALASRCDNGLRLATRS